MVRPRRSEDIARCVALLREVHRADRYPVVWPEGPAGWLTGRDLLGAWVAEDDDGDLLGQLSLHGTGAARARPQWLEALGVGPERLAVVSRFFVSPRARGRGVGGALMRRAEEHAAAHGRRLVLDVAAHNRDAMAFYERRGWQRVGTAELALSADPWTLDLVLFVRETR
jgi:GNAT superfamily N-acetyltransferase